jgi:hypothetical protein
MDTPLALTMNGPSQLIGAALGIFSIVVIVQVIMDNQREYLRKRKREASRRHP